MASTRNSLTQYVPDAGYVSGLLTPGASPTVTLLSGFNADQGCVSVTRGGVGVYTITVKQFLGANGVALGRGTPTLSGVMVATSTGTYSGNAMSMQFGIMDNAGSYSDTAINFEIRAY